MAEKLRVGLTRDVLDSRGEPAFGRAALSILEGAPSLEWEYLPRIVREIDAEHAARYDAVYVNIARVPGSAVARSDCRVRVIARHGVGYDTVDVPAMTRAGVLVTNTPTPMPRPVATVALTFILALAGKLFLKDKLTRTARWHERMDNMGMGLTGRTLGIVGAGRIGQEIMRVVKPLDMKMLAADPFANALELSYLGARKVDLAELLAQSDFVVVACLLNERTRHLMGAEQFARMKQSAYFINVARGPIVDEPALIAALQSGRLAGAGLDVTAEEPLPVTSPLLRLENVLVTPHSAASVADNFQRVAEHARRNVASVLAGTAVPAEDVVYWPPG